MFRCATFYRRLLSLASSTQQHENNNNNSHEDIINRLIRDNNADSARYLAAITDQLLRYNIPSEKLTAVDLRMHPAALDFNDDDDVHPAAGLGRGPSQSQQVLRKELSAVVECAAAAGTVMHLPRDVVLAPYLDLCGVAVPHDNSKLIDAVLQESGRRCALRKAPPRVIFYDIEATGLNIVSDRIVEIAFHDVTTGAKYTTLVNPGVPIPPEVTAIHNITDKDVAAAPTWGEVAADVRNFILGNDDDATEVYLVAHAGLRFDHPMLLRALAAAGAPLGRTPGTRVVLVDSFPVVRTVRSTYTPIVRTSLSAAAQHIVPDALGVSSLAATYDVKCVDPEAALHRASTDVELLVGVLEAVVNAVLGIDAAMSGAAVATAPFRFGDGADGCDVTPFLSLLGKTVLTTDHGGAVAAATSNGGQQQTCFALLNERTLPWYRALYSSSSASSSEVVDLLLPRTILVAAAEEAETLSQLLQKRLPAGVDSEHTEDVNFALALHKRCRELARSK
eukprot:PhM_4_TR4500/c0_g1_i1/m.50459